MPQDSECGLDTLTPTDFRKLNFFTQAKVLLKVFSILFKVL